MVAVKIQGVTYPIPTSIEDITIERFIEFRQISPNSVLDTMYWVLGCKVNFDETSTIEQELANVLTLAQQAIDEMYSFLNSKSKNDIPKEVTLFNEVFKLKDGLLNDLPYWPYVITKNIVINAIGKEAFDPTDDIPRVLAHYLYSYCTNREYTEKDAEEFIEVVNDIPMKEAIQLGNFFLSKHRSLFPSSKKLSRMKLSLTT